MVESCGVCKFGSGQLREASRGALNRWLKGEFDADIAENTRCFILEAQEANWNIQLAEEWMLFEESSGEPVTGLAPPPGMCVSEQNMRMDTVCNVHTLHCSEHLTMAVSPLSCAYLYAVCCPTAYI